MIKFLLVLMLTGCATLFGSGPDYVPVSTNPPGAWVYYDGAPVGQTPTVVRLERGRPAQIQIAMDGFQPVLLQRDSSINGWFYVNILWFAAILPWVIDLVDGDWQRFDDTPIAIGLVPMRGGPAPYQQPQQPYQQPGQPGQPMPPQLPPGGYIPPPPPP